LNRALPDLEAEEPFEESFRRLVGTESRQIFTPLRGCDRASVRGHLRARSRPCGPMLLSTPLDRVGEDVDSGVSLRADEEIIVRVRSKSKQDTECIGSTHPKFRAEALSPLKLDTQGE